MKINFTKKEYRLLLDMVEMEFEERATKLLEIESIYYKELECYGIDNLRFENLSPSDKTDLH
jgi:hypothetical protein